jgi:cyanophycinase-like exopeptidase
MNERIFILKKALKKIMRKDIESDRFEAIETHSHVGPVIAIGGAESKTYNGEILNKVFQISGGKGIDITIIPWASEKKVPEKYIRKYSNISEQKIFFF